MTTKRRAGGSGHENPFMKTVPPTAVVPEVATPTPGVLVPEGEAAADEVMSKYTVNLDGETAAMFDHLALIARRKLGRRVEKSKMIRALIRMANADTALREQMLDEIGKRA